MGNSLVDAESADLTRQCRDPPQVMESCVMGTHDQFASQI